METPEKDGQDGGDQVRLLMGLVSLKEIRDHQHTLQQMRGKLERCYGDYTECRDFAMQCGAELSKLEGERLCLQNRQQQIEADMIQMTDLKKELETASTHCVMSAPTELYKVLEEQVNEKRKTLGMEMLPECEAFSKLSSDSIITSSSKQKRHFRQSNSHGNSRAHPYSSTAVKAGPSYKQCPKCDQLIPRNAVICSNCHSLCSRPGHSTGKNRL
ncbi:uncharacterized protein LOC135350324 [Halichondria panicea]|uniref:uncharacterized protein LOC135350324 n=1 Tax=Halichondria panicea TaxID=6063 RepID=UPI00312B491D